MQEYLSSPQSTPVPSGIPASGRLQETPLRGCASALPARAKDEGEGSDEESRRPTGLTHCFPSGQAEPAGHHPVLRRGNCVSFSPPSHPAIGSATPSDNVVPTSPAVIQRQQGRGRAPTRNPYPGFITSQPVPASKIVINPMPMAFIRRERYFGERGEATTPRLPSPSTNRVRSKLVPIRPTAGAVSPSPPPSSRI